MGALGALLQLSPAAATFEAKDSVLSDSIRTKKDLFKLNFLSKVTLWVIQALMLEEI